MSKNSVTSIRARLKNVADKEQKPFDFVLLLYFIERLLYRLSISRYSDRFVLKGGLLLYTIMNEKARATKDIDMLAWQIASNLDELKKIFSEIAQIAVDDAVTYDTVNITSERIKEDADYEGVRIKLTAYLGNAHKTLQFDIGFGDVIVPKPQVMEYPVLLDMDRPVIQTYSKESVIAEKFEAMLYLAEANSRMKDFYDIYCLCTNYDFDGRVLFEAITQTLVQRRTPLSKHPVVFSDEFAQNKDKHIQWNAFRRRANVAINIEFDEILKEIRAFLKPVFEVVIEEHEFFRQWSSIERKWSFER
jgi:predicted nucleotidyltransferase component of viral defense system